MKPDNLPSHVTKGGHMTKAWPSNVLRVKADQHTQAECFCHKRDLRVVGSVATVTLENIQTHIHLKHEPLVHR